MSGKNSDLVREGAFVACAPVGESPSLGRRDKVTGEFGGRDPTQVAWVDSVSCIRVERYISWFLLLQKEGFRQGLADDVCSAVARRSQRSS